MPLDIDTSEENDLLIVVNAQNEVCDYKSKQVCHNGEGILHRAFSLFIFNPIGELLIQQRSRKKRLWPLYWSNSCCSHPRKGESMDAATQRRLQEELGIQSDLKYLYQFSYHASYKNEGSENELCSVFVGSCADPVCINPNEIDGFRFIKPDTLDKEFQNETVAFTPWFKLEWEHLNTHFRKNVRDNS